MRGKDNCDQCTSPNACDQSSNSMYLNNNGDCGTQCPSGYTGIGSEVTGRTCEACEPNCGQCTDSSTCTQCSNSMYLTNNGDCVRTCPSGYTDIGSGANGVSGYTTGRTCEENAACSTFTCPNTDINKGLNVKCFGTATSSCNKHACCEDKATCDTFGCEDTHFNKGSDVTCSALAITSCDSGTCCEVKITCESFSSCNGDAPVNKGSSVDCSADVASCNADTCCEPRGTCDTLTGSRALPVNKGRGVECPGGALRCVARSCCEEKPT